MRPYLFIISRKVSESKVIRRTEKRVDSTFKKKKGQEAQSERKGRENRQPRTKYKTVPAPKKERNVSRAKSLKDLLQERGGKRGRQAQIAQHHRGG